MANASHMNYSNYPLKDIPQPHAHDVLCGRGGGTNNHIGNSHWRMLVAANKQLYITLPKRQKMLLSRSIVNAVRSQNPPGRFLQKDNKSNLWFDVGDQRAVEKTSQALREGAPDIRKKAAAAAAQDDGATDAPDSITGKSSGEGISEKANSSNNNNNNNTMDHPSSASVSETSGTATPSGDHLGGSMASRSSSAAAASSSNHPFPPQVSASAGQMNHNNNFPNNMSGVGVGGSFHDPMMQQGMGMFDNSSSNNNNAAMMQMQMMYQTMMMNNMFNNGGNNNMMNPAVMMTPQQQQHMMQMMMANMGMMNMQQGSNNNDMPASSSSQNNTEYHHHHQQQQQQQQSNHDLEPLPLPTGSNHHRTSVAGDRTSINVNSLIPTFDEFVQSPPDGLEPAGLSYGSMSMSESEIRRIQLANASFGSSAASTMRMSNFGNNSGNNNSSSSSNNMIHMQNHNMRHHPQQQQQGEGVPPALDGLEPTGISFGDVSMMSAGTGNMMKLEDTGTSFGTMMSLNTIKTDMVESGGLLENIGTSFGSLSLDPKNREALFRTLEMAADGPEIPPMFQSEQKSKGNLLDCSDTESESEDNEKLTAQKSQAWERMKQATETKLKEQKSKGSVASHDLMPPPIGFHGNSGNKKVDSTEHLVKQQPSTTSGAGFVNTEVAIPTTTFENNLSTLSAWSAADDFDADAEDNVSDSAAAGTATTPR